MTKDQLASPRTKPGVVTIRQTPAIAWHPNLRAARAGVAEAGRDPGVSVEKDEREASRASHGALPLSLLRFVVVVGKTTQNPGASIGRWDNSCSEHTDTARLNGRRTPEWMIFRRFLPPSLQQ